MKFDFRKGVQKAAMGVVLASVVAMTPGCKNMLEKIGFDNDGDKTATTTSTVPTAPTAPIVSSNAISGKAADPYFKNSNVCFYLKGKFDPEDKYKEYPDHKDCTQTDETGSYTLDLDNLSRAYTDEELKEGEIVVYGGTHNGKNNHKYIGSKLREESKDINITPASNIIAQKVKDENISLADAYQLVANDSKLEVAELYKDPEEKDSEGKEINKKLSNYVIGYQTTIDTFEKMGLSQTDSVKMAALMISNDTSNDSPEEKLTKALTKAKASDYIEITSKQEKSIEEGKTLISKTLETAINSELPSSALSSLMEEVVENTDFTDEKSVRDAATKVDTIKTENPETLKEKANLRLLANQLGLTPADGVGTDENLKSIFDLLKDTNSELTLTDKALTESQLKLLNTMLVKAAANAPDAEKTLIEKLQVAISEKIQTKKDDGKASLVVTFDQPLYYSVNAKATKDACDDPDVKCEYKLNYLISSLEASGDEVKYRDQTDDSAIELNLSDILAKEFTGKKLLVNREWKTLEAGDTSLERDNKKLFFKLGRTRIASLEEKKAISLKNEKRVFNSSITIDGKKLDKRLEVEFNDLDDAIKIDLKFRNQDSIHELSDATDDDFASQVALYGNTDFSEEVGFGNITDKDDRIIANWEVTKLSDDNLLLKIKDLRKNKTKYFAKKDNKYYLVKHYKFSELVPALPAKFKAYNQAAWDQIKTVLDKNKTYTKLGDYYAAHVIKEDNIKNGFNMLVSHLDNKQYRYGVQTFNFSNGTEKAENKLFNGSSFETQSVLINGEWKASSNKVETKLLHSDKVLEVSSDILGQGYLTLISESSSASLTSYGNGKLDTTNKVYNVSFDPSGDLKENYILTHKVNNSTVNNLGSFISDSDYSLHEYGREIWEKRSSDKIEVIKLGKTDQTGRFQLSAQSDTTGDVYYQKYPLYKNSKPEYSDYIGKVGSNVKIGSWEIKTVQGKQLLLVDITELGYSDLERSFWTIKDSKVWQGYKSTVPKNFKVYTGDTVTEIQTALSGSEKSSYFKEEYLTFKGQIKDKTGNWLEAIVSVTVDGNTYYTANNAIFRLHTQIPVDTDKVTLNIEAKGYESKKEEVPKADYSKVIDVQLERVSTPFNNYVAELSAASFEKDDGEYETRSNGCFSGDWSDQRKYDPSSKTFKNDKERYYWNKNDKKWELKYCTRNIDYTNQKLDINTKRESYRLTVAGEEDLSGQTKNIDGLSVTFSKGAKVYTLSHQHISNKGGWYYLGKEFKDSAADSFAGFIQEIINSKRSIFSHEKKSNIALTFDKAITEFSSKTGSVVSHSIDSYDDQTSEGTFEIKVISDSNEEIMIFNLNNPSDYFEDADEDKEYKFFGIKDSSIWVGTRSTAETRNNPGNYTYKSYNAQALNDIKAVLDKNDSSSNPGGGDDSGKPAPGDSNDDFSALSFISLPSINDIVGEFLGELDESNGKVQLKASKFKDGKFFDDEGMLDIPGSLSFGTPEHATPYTISEDTITVKGENADVYSSPKKADLNGKSISLKSIIKSKTFEDFNSEVREKLTPVISFSTGHKLFMITVSGKTEYLFNESAFNHIVTELKKRLNIE